ncbi:MAG: hypothetical protein MET45_11930 [Nostoc sp. LLA-1]|nr:hypothetical protein [Cyanocohniella sp. LLY]
MIEIGWFSAKLFFKGKLIRDPLDFVVKIAIASSMGSLILLLLSQFNCPLWSSIVTASLATGLVMPFLLKDFKMK